MQSRPKYYLTVLNHLEQVLLATNSAELWSSSEEGHEQERVEVRRDEEGEAVRREVAVMSSGGRSAVGEHFCWMTLMYRT